MRQFLLVIACSLVLMGVGRAETVSVIAPATSTDGNNLTPIDEIVAFYLDGTCGTSYCNATVVKGGGTATCTGAVLVKGTYTFSARATTSVTGGGQSACGGVTSYTYGGTYIPAAPGVNSITIIR